MIPVELGFLEFQILLNFEKLIRSWGQVIHESIIYNL